MAPPVPFFPLNSSLGAFFLSLVSISAGEAALAQPSANCIEEKSLEGIGKKETLTNSNKRETGCSRTKHFRTPAKESNTSVISQLREEASLNRASAALKCMREVTVVEGTAGSRQGWVMVLGSSICKAGGYDSVELQNKTSN